MKVIFIDNNFLRINRFTFEGTFKKSTFNIFCSIMFVVTSWARSKIQFSSLFVLLSRIFSKLSWSASKNDSFKNHARVILESIDSLIHWTDLVYLVRSLYGFDVRMFNTLIIRIFINNNFLKMHIYHITVYLTNKTDFFFK